MSVLPVIIIGSGGHAAVVADALMAAGRRVLGFTDNDASRHGFRLCGLVVLGGDSALARHAIADVELANGIGGAGKSGTAGLRSHVQLGLEAQGWRFASVRHPSAVVSPFAQVGAGTQLLAACVVQAGAAVARGCIINTAAVVEHDTQLEAFVHVACGAVLCGNVTVGTHSHIGAGAVIRQGVQLGEHSVVGAGAVVLNNFPGGGTLLGVPAVAQKVAA